MSMQPIEGRVVGRTSPPPRSEYVLREVPGGTGGGGDTSGGGGGRIRETASLPARLAMREQQQAPVPGGVPRFLGSRMILSASWLVSMALVAVDEWKNNGIMPRPARLWATSLFYGLLALVSLVDIMVPLVNALAIGYTIMLLWQYFNGNGQFATGG